MPDTNPSVRRGARTRAGLSLRDLEEATGINRGLLSWWERGKFTLTTEQETTIEAAISAAITNPMEDTNP